MWKRWCCSIRAKRSNAVMARCVHDILTRYDVDVAAATLTRRTAIKVPAKAQYAWPDRSGSYFYVSTSNGGPRLKSDYNHVTAYVVGGDSALSQHGESRPLTRRAVHM